LPGENNPRIRFYRANIILKFPRELQKQSDHLPLLGENNLKISSGRAKSIPMDVLQFLPCENNPKVLSCRAEKQQQKTTLDQKLRRLSKSISSETPGEPCLSTNVQQGRATGAQVMSGLKMKAQ